MRVPACVPGTAPSIPPLRLRVKFPSPLPTRLLYICIWCMFAPQINFPQVAEAFAVDLVESEGRGAGSGQPPLHELVRLDTCVTVVDAATLMDNL